jgi:hypothetical protein
MRLLALAALIAALVGGSACSAPCCTYDSRPIRLQRAAGGELMVRLQDDDGAKGTALVDTGTPVTVFADGTDGVVGIRRHDLRLLGPDDTAGNAPIRALLDGVTMIHAPLSALSDGTAPMALLGGDLLTSFSVEFGFAVPELVLWPEQPAPDGFLSAAGYAVLRIRRRGAGETEAVAPSSGIGPSGPYQFPSSLLAMRACATPAVFDREAPLPQSCCVGDEQTLATGVDLALLLGTGYGPIILSRSAWARVTRNLVPPPVTTVRALHAATATQPILDAQWSTLPRLALVDREADTAVNPGPCVELGRSRRLEQVALAQSRNAERAVCALPCDQDPRSAGSAQNAAAYIELGGDLPVAIIDDGDPLLGGRGAQIFPDGPQIDGILGAAALRNARVEIDYRGQPARAIFSCAPDVAESACRTVGRCPRLPGAGQTHTCFGRPAHALPGICDNLPAECP